MDRNFTFLLGRVENAAHENRLLEVAHRLEANKFSCLFSIVDGMAMFDVMPHDPDAWPPDSDFRIYAAEHIIHVLGKSLA
jgi:hypothetical protein